jgi:hypothetical protein
VSNGDQWAAWRSRADVLILHHSRPEVLVERRDGAWRVPRMPIDQLWKVPLGTINHDVRRIYGIETTILLLISQQRDDAACTITSLRLLENHSPDWAPPPAMRWAGAAELGAVTFANAEQGQAAEEILAERRIPVLRPPWARPGWYREAAGWLEAALASSGYRPSGAIEQIKTWDLSCILRVPTERGAVYFKATNPAPLMANEARVSAGLAAMFPDRVPAPLVADPERGWLALADFGPAVLELGFATPLDVRAAVLADFGRLQIAAADQIERLLAIGCADRRLAQLAAAIDPLLADELTMAGIEAEQRERLRAAGPALKALCARLDAGRVPATLVHGDLHLANVAQGASGYLFFDWCDAAVSHPFLDMSDILHEADPAIQTRLRDSYLAVWTDYEPLERLAQLWRLAHPLCALYQAVSYRSLIRHTEPRNRPDLAWAMPFWADQIVSSLESVGGGF